MKRLKLRLWEREFLLEDRSFTFVLAGYDRSMTL